MSKFRTIVETKANALIGACLNKLNWQQKLTDSVIRAKWEREATEAGTPLDIISYCMADLDKLALRMVDPGTAWTPIFPGIYMADESVPADF